MKKRLTLVSVIAFWLSAAFLHSVSWDGLSVKTATWPYFSILDEPSESLDTALHFPDFSECLVHVIECMCSHMNGGVTIQLSVLEITASDNYGDPKSLCT